LQKKYISKFQSVLLIFEIFFLKNGTVFRAKAELSLVLPKFDWNFFSKNSKENGSGGLKPLYNAQED
jgi:hypothetical protein